MTYNEDVNGKLAQIVSVAAVDSSVFVAQRTRTIVDTRCKQTTPKLALKCKL